MPEEVARFWSKVEKTDDCWLWTGALNDGGYGQLTHQGRSYEAHRWIICVLARQRLSRTLRVCHTCDNPRCVHPGHLFLGSQKLNMEDASRKGRLKPQSEAARLQRGDRSPRAKVSDEQALEMARLRNDGATLKSIAERFGISRAQVGRILQGVARQHLELYVSPDVGRKKAETTEGIAKAVIARCRAGEQAPDIAISLGLSVFTVYDIVRGRSWKHLPRPH